MKGPWGKLSRLPFSPSRYLLSINRCFPVIFFSLLKRKRNTQTHQTKATRTLEQDFACKYFRWFQQERCHGLSVLARCAFLKILSFFFFFSKQSATGHNQYLSHYSHSPDSQVQLERPFIVGPPPGYIPKSAKKKKKKLLKCLLVTMDSTTMDVYR